MRPALRSCRTAPLVLAARRQSGKRDSNPRPQPWQGCALPTELFPRSGRRILASGSRPRNAPTRRPDGGTGPTESGGEGDRTPDLVNAIHALSQLSYAPGTSCYILTAPRRTSTRCRDSTETVAAAPERASSGVLFSATCRRRTPDHGDDPRGPPSDPPTRRRAPITDDLTTAEILASRSRPSRAARASARRDAVSASTTPTGTSSTSTSTRSARRRCSPPQQEIAIARARAAPATTRRCRSWSSGTSASSSPSPRNIRTAGSRSPI